MFRSSSFLIVVLCLKFVHNQTTYVCSANAPCGCSSQSATLSRIVGGETASTGTWGWAASLRHSSSGSHFCGGTIITDSHILTAAHCTKDLGSASAIRVVVGSIYLYSGEQQRTVSKIVNHPSYDSKTFANDISILKLSSPLNFDEVGIDRICLTNVSSTILNSQEYPPANINLVAIGWGVTSEGSTAVSSVLRQVTIKSVSGSSSYCENLSPNLRVQFCAGVMPTGGKDTCQGDSGGPLMMFNSQNRWEIVGITSNGYGCARPNLPGLYTRVAAYQSWINETINGARPQKSISFVIFLPFLLVFAR